MPYNNQKPNNSQPSPYAAPLTSNQPSKTSGWRYFFIILGILQASGVALFLLVWLWAVLQSRSGVSGMEFIILILLVTVAPAVAVISLINLIGLPIYMIKRKPQGKRMVLAIMSLLISILLVGYGVYSIYGVYFYPRKLSKESRQDIEQRTEDSTKVQAETAPVTTKEEALNFMRSCKADYFVGYTDLKLVKDDNTKGWLELAEESQSGLEISTTTPKKYVFASKAMTVELQDTVRQIRQSCYSTKKLYLTVDNWIETEYPQGVWTRVSR